MFSIVSYCPFNVEGTKGQTSNHTFVGFFVLHFYKIGREGIKEIRFSLTISSPTRI